MPKKIEPEVRDRALRLSQTHGGKCSSPTAAAESIATQVGVGRETVCHWAVQAQIDGGTRAGVTSEESAELKKLKAGNRQLREDVAILKSATTFFAGELDPPQPMIIAFMDTMRSEGAAVESICRIPCARASRSPHAPIGPGTVANLPHALSPTPRPLTRSVVSSGV